MNPAALMLGVGIAIAAGAFAFIWPRISERMAKAQARAECDALREQLELARAAGGDVSASAQIEIQLKACLRRLSEIDATADVDSTAVAACQTLAAQVGHEWANYRRTGYNDPVRRDNQRGAMFRLATELSTCVDEASAGTDDVTTIRRLLDIIDKAIVDSHARTACYIQGGDGCGRFALNEEPQRTRALAERTRIAAPLVATRRELLARLVSAAEKQARADAAARRKAAA